MLFTGIGFKIVGEGGSWKSWSKNNSFWLTNKLLRGFGKVGLVKVIGDVDCDWLVNDGRLSVSISIDKKFVIS